MRIAACAVLVRGDRVLLGRRSPLRDYYPGAWDVFGGHVETGELPAAALIRELREELGIVPADARAVLVVAEPRPDAHGPGEFHVYAVTRWTGEPTLRNAEHDALGWFTLAEATQLDLADPALIAVLDHVLRVAGTTGGR